MERVTSAVRLVRRADDLASRFRLVWYLLRSALGRWGLRWAVSGSRPLQFNLGGISWEIREASSQLGGIHDVWLDREYDAVPGFKAGRGATVVDVGANVGAYSLWQSSNAGPTGTVIAVEASATTAAILRANLERNGAAVKVVEAACWTTPGTVEFTASDRSSSTAGVSSAVDSRLIRGGRSTEVRSITLESILSNAAGAGRIVDVLKIDIEGAELDVLTATPAEVLRSAARIVVEVDDEHWGAVRDVLQSAGFVCVARRKHVGYFSIE